MRTCGYNAVSIGGTTCSVLDRSGLTAAPDGATGEVGMLRQVRRILTLDVAIQKEDMHHEKNRKAFFVDSHPVIRMGDGRFVPNPFIPASLTPKCRIPDRGSPTSGID